MSVSVVGPPVASCAEKFFDDIIVIHTTLAVSALGITLDSHVTTDFMFSLRFLIYYHLNRCRSQMRSTKSRYFNQFRSVTLSRHAKSFLLFKRQCGLVLGWPRVALVDSNNNKQCSRCMVARPHRGWRRRNLQMRQSIQSKYDHTSFNYLFRITHYAGFITPSSSPKMISRDFRYYAFIVRPRKKREMREELSNLVASAVRSSIIRIRRVYILNITHELFIETILLLFLIMQ